MPNKELLTSTSMTLTIAISYGGMWDMAHAASKAIFARCAGKITVKVDRN